MNIPVSQRIVEITLEANGGKHWCGNSTAPYFLVRDASNTFLLELVKKQGGNTCVEVKRNDTLDVTDFTDVTLINPHDVEVIVKYQLADVPIGRQNDELDVTGAVDVNEIKEPITVDVINSPVNIGEMPPVEIESLPAVDINGEVNVNVKTMPDAPLDVNVAGGSLEVSNVIEVKPEDRNMKLVKSGFGYTTFDQYTKQISGGNYDTVIMIADKNNTGSVWISGFIELEAGEHFIMPGAHFTADGEEGDRLYYGGTQPW